MKITDIVVGRFGVWQGLKLPLRSSGLNVFYGPNEAGKTTLLRFVRGVLYGFDPLALETGDGERRDPQWQGALRIEHDGGLAEIARTACAGARGDIVVSGMDETLTPDERLARLLGGVDEAVFRSVFAIGLSELQELATLQRDEVASHIYGLTLGAEGRRLLDVLERIPRERQALRAEASELLRRDNALRREIDALAALRGQHVDLCGERRGIEERVAALRHRQSQAHLQLRGHLFLERVSGPWGQIRECDDELEQTPEVPGFPDRGLQRLDELERQIAELTAARNELESEADRLHDEAEALRPDPEVQRHAGAMQALVDQREWLHEVHESLAAAKAQLVEGKAELNARVAEIGPQWTSERIDKVDTSPAAHYRLIEAARSYRSAVARRGRFKRRSLRRSEACHQRVMQIEERVREAGAASVEAALDAARRRREDAEELARLKVREADMSERLASLGAQLDELESRLALPPWVYVVLALFAAAGLFCAVMGFSRGLSSNGVAGLMWALLGVTCGGLAWALKTHFAKAVREGIERLQQEESRHEQRLREVRDEIIRLERVEAGASPGDVPPPLTDAERIRRAAQAVSEFERLADEHARLCVRRKQLSAWRKRLPVIQREVAAARQQWCELVTGVGLDETLRVDEALEVWQKACEAARRKRALEASAEELRGMQKTWQSLRNRVEDLGRRLGREGVDYAQPLLVLAAWDEELKRVEASRAEIRRLRREEKERRADVEELRPKIDELTTRRGALLVQGGAATRDEFEHRAALAKRRAELEELRALAESELEIVRRTEPDLAIVEDDLEAFDAQVNAERVAGLNREIEEIEFQLLVAHEELGRVKQEIESLEADRRATELRHARAQLEGELLHAAERLCALEWSARVVDHVKADYERTRQPAVLAGAREYLEQLTEGRYRNVWAPLGTRDLRLEDDRGRTVGVEQLSNGAREQLFLAVRLAMARELAGQGIELPLVLDDILVNFDQRRTEAAIDTLIRVAEGGQQILFFTCHLHLAHLVESRGIEPTWLPGHQPLLAARLAG